MARLGPPDGSEQVLLDDLLLLPLQFTAPDRQKFEASDSLDSLFTRSVSQMTHDSGSSQTCCLTPPMNFLRAEDHGYQN